MSNILKVEDHKSIIQSSRIVWSEGCAPVRVVLRDHGGEFVTHLENLRLEDGVFKHDGFSHGHYFGRDATKATEDYHERRTKL